MQSAVEQSDMDATVTAIPQGDRDLTEVQTVINGVTEIRVHGVGGSTPESMLGEPSVQVAGDQWAGFWRGASRVVNGRECWHREAYSWGGLTARSWSTALWLVFLPFALTNLAGWMSLGNYRRTPDSYAVDWRIPYQQALVRVICLCTTWTYVLFTAQLFMDLGSWQCTQAEQCRARGIWNWIGPGTFFERYPLRAAALAALVPVLFVVVMGRVSMVSRDRYESFSEARNPQPLSRWICREHRWPTPIFGRAARTPAAAANCTWCPPFSSLPRCCLDWLNTATDTGWCPWSCSG